MFIRLTCGVLLAVALATPLTTASEDVRGAFVDTLESAGTAPLFCIAGTACAGSGCALDSRREDASCSEGSGSCGSDQYYTVDGEYDSGNGTIKISVKCGDETLVECTVDTPDVDCDTPMPKGPGDGGFKCLKEIVNGTPEGLSGYCIDPAQPSIVYLAVPPGVPYEIAKYAVHIAENGERLAFDYL